MTDLLEESARAHPDALAVADVRGGSLTFGQLAGAATTLARELDGLGGGGPGTVAVVMPNSMAAVTAIWGALTSRHSLAVLHPSLPEPAVRRALGHIGALAVVRPEPGPSGFRVHARAPAKRRAGPPDLPAGLPRPLQPALMILTSGTLGRPKAIVCSGEQVAWSARAISGELGYRPSDVVACVPPFSFDYGLYQLLLAAGAGAAVLVDPLLEAAQPVAAAIARHGVTVLPVVPPFLRLLCASGLLERLSTATVRLITTTGDFLHDRDVERAARAFPCSRIAPMFGLSECKRVAITPAGRRRPPGAVGLPLPGTAVAIADGAMVPLAAGAVGELVVAGSHVTLGYRGDRRATRERFVVDRESGLRVLRTGDLLERDDAGWLYWHGRGAELIKTSGYRVSCAEIERAASAAPAVAEVGAFGRADADRGELPVAVVRLAEGVTAEEGSRQLRDVLARRLPRWAIPRVELTAAPLPRSRHGKLDRSRLDPSRLAAGRGGHPNGARAEAARPRPRRTPVRLLSDGDARAVPVSRRFVACHTQACLSAFRLPRPVSAEEFELLTSVPFGTRHVAGDMHRCVAPYLDPDRGLDRALTALGIEFELVYERSTDGAAGAFERLDAWLATGPALLGPLDIGGLSYLPHARALAGCDHYVVALGVSDRGDAYLLRDPEGFVQVELSRRELESSWARVGVREGRGPFTMRRVLNRGDHVPRPRDELWAGVVRDATANLACAAATAHCGSDAWESLKRLARTPSAQRSLSFLLPAASYRALLASRFFRAPAPAPLRRPAGRAAALLDEQVTTLGAMNGSLHRDGWIRPEQLDAMVSLEGQVAAEARRLREAIDRHAR